MEFKEDFEIQESMDEGYRDFIAFVIFIILIGGVIGWMIPVKSPLENTKQADIRHKAPTKNIVLAKEKQIYIDLDNDNEPEWYTMIPRDKDKE